MSTTAIIAASITRVTRRRNYGASWSFPYCFHRLGQKGTLLSWRLCQPVRFAPWRV
jgi:hypothetical protein